MTNRKRFLVRAGLAVVIACIAAALAYYWFARPGTVAKPVLSEPFSQYSEDEKRQGLHCLQPDGSHAGVVAWVEEQLPYPDSFRHRGTAMFAVRNGKHFLVMRYQSLADNGHRTDAAVAVARIDHQNCTAGGLERLD